MSSHIAKQTLQSDYMQKVEDYWIDRELGDVFVCPNVSLFRLIGSAVGKLKGKRILEVGFGLGADIKECQRRGALVTGLDLNPKYVEALRKFNKIEAYVFNAGLDQIPSNNSYDLIYSRDTIYYLSDDQLSHFFDQCCQKLTTTGKLIVQFIEKDFKLIVDETKSTKNFTVNFLKNYDSETIYNKDNPIRQLAAEDILSIAKKNDLKTGGSKIHLQSYDLEEKEIRVDRYLIFSKASK